jgi:monoamine oxidase
MILGFPSGQLSARNDSVPRYSLLNTLLGIAAEIDRAHHPGVPSPGWPGIERRAVLRGAASIAGAALLPRLPALAAAEARVAVVGAGLAGLTAAHDLFKAGLKPTVYEGSTRVGGRCYTIRSFPNQVAEHGGEFIDSTHDAIRGLAAALELQLDDLLAAEPKNSTSLYAFGGGYSVAQAQKDYAALYPLIQDQAKQIGDFSYKESNLFARTLDHITLAEWVTRYVPGGRASKLGQLIENAITEEYAADATAVSGLTPAPLFAPNTRTGFNLYYPGSDQRYHVRGGNDQIPRLLGEKLGDAVQTGAALVAVGRLPDSRIRLALNRDSRIIEAAYDRVILALPFSILNQLDTSKAGFRPLKRRAIATLGMGSSTKFQLRFRERVWLAAGCAGEIRLQSDLFQTTWDVTRAQSGDSGILNFWSGGRQAERSAALDPVDLAQSCLAEAERLLPGLTAAWTGEMTRDAWRDNPWSLGSYSYQPLGYATALSGIEAEPEGNCFFAGEHTARQSGYLNAAVETGQRAAKEVLASLK